MTKQICNVSIPHTNRDFFDYLVSDIEPCIGARVWVPFRNKRRLGVVIGLCESEHLVMALKSIEALIDDKPLFSRELLSLCQWISHYYQSPLSEVIPLALPKRYRRGDVCSLPTSTHYKLLMPPDLAHQKLKANAARQHALVDFLTGHVDGLSKQGLLNAGFNSIQINALVASGVLHESMQIDKPLYSKSQPDTPLPLNDEQSHALDKICDYLHVYQCFLLKGVTGSGKTEVYLQVIARVLAQGKQVLVLVPEIGLTPQLLARFTARFPEPIAVIHSHLNDSERLSAWQLANAGLVNLVIGTRSALFTPMPLLGLIVIDEEHDASFKQMDGVRYSARDAALVRAKTLDIPIILGSATPSLESLYNANQKKYTLLSLHQKALNSQPLHYQILDIRNQVLQQGLASATLTKIKAHLQDNNQVLVFINRRGFAPVLLCHQCGWMADCRACDSHLTLHRSINRLICHHCGLKHEVPLQCHICHSRELLPIGVGTQRVHDYLASQFPTYTTVRVDRDEVAKKHALDEQLARISSGDVQLIVGTQMLAKGHHFPRLTLVVILDTDNGFYNQDFRAMERLGQLLTQVAGRAGRAEFPGQVIIQTHLPQHPLLNVLIQQGYDAFASALLETRFNAGLPPYHYLALMRAQSSAPARLLRFLHAVKAQLKDVPVSVLGPAPSPLSKKASQYRMQLLMNAPSRQKRHRALTQLREWLTMEKISQTVRWNIDVDPMDLS